MGRGEEEEEEESGVRGEGGKVRNERQRRERERGKRGKDTWERHMTKDLMFYDHVITWRTVMVS